VVGTGWQLSRCAFSQQLGLTKEAPRIDARVPWTGHLSASLRSLVVHSVGTQLPVEAGSQLSVEAGCDEWGASVNLGQLLAVAMSLSA
jgi:hypothetical protein